MHQLLLRVTSTPADCPADRLPPPCALTPPLLPVTLQFTGPPWATTVTVQWREPRIVQPYTARVPGAGWAGGGAAADGDVGCASGDCDVLSEGVGLGVGVLLESDGDGLADVAPSFGSG